MSKILLIDDEEANVRLLTKSLQSDGHHVVSALSGEEGLNMFQREYPELVLTDIKMPGMDGIEVLQRIKEMHRDAEVIIITGHGDMDNAVEALKLGASDFISKPIRDEVLSVALQRAKEKRAINIKLKEYTQNLEREVQSATQEVRRKTNFLTKLIRSSNDAVIATDKTMTIVIYNQAAMRIFGYRRHEVIDVCKITDILPGDIAAIFTQPLSKHAKGKEMARMETMILAKDHSIIPVFFYATPLYEKDAMVGTVSFFHDLRGIKRLERELVNAERLAAIGQTIAGVAHGVKNILHGFKGGSYLVDLGINKSDDVKLKKGWEMIQRNIGRTSELVLDLLTYSKEREPEYRACDPNAMIEDVCEVMQDRAEEHGIKLTTELDLSIQSVIMDPHTIHQCLTNLISNAIDACLFDQNTQKQWQVTIKSKFEDNRCIRISIIDNGMGMSDAVQKKLFASFFSTKGHRGTGLGLLVTRKAVEEHGGIVEVDSKEGEGTVFTLKLPFQHLEKTNKMNIEEQHQQSDSLEG